MAERIALELDRERFGVEAVYLFGSVKNATAGPASDIDLLLHVNADAEQRRQSAAPPVDSLDLPDEFRDLLPPR